MGRIVMSSAVDRRRHRIRVPVFRAFVCFVWYDITHIVADLKLKAAPLPQWFLQGMLLLFTAVLGCRNDG